MYTDVCKTNATMQLAQVNIARFNLPSDHPVNQDFVDNIDRVNALAEVSPGFIWRFDDYEGENDSPPYPDDPLMIFNCSVWQDIESLKRFVYGNAEHKNIMRRRKEWFEPPRLHLALWWIEPGHIPSVEEAKQRLAHLAEHGATAEAFNFAQCFNARGERI